MHCGRTCDIATSILAIIALQYMSYVYVSVLESLMGRVDSVHSIP